MKYRIIERKYNNGEVVYFCQHKILFWWFTLKDLNGYAYGFRTLEAVREYINRRIYNEKTIEA